jgi:hypothetical protein
MWGRDVGVLVVVDMVGEDLVVEEEDVVDMVFDEICVRGKKGDEGQFICSDTM